MAIDGDGDSGLVERLVFFSDAVFAIAITLLIIEVRPPRLPAGATDQDQLSALVANGASFVSFAVSFAVIGAFWAAHHRMFAMAANWSPRLLRPNLALLALIAFIPFTTAYMGMNWGQRVPTALYDLVLLLAALANIALAAVVTRPPVAIEGADEARLLRTRARGWGVAAGSAFALAIALVVPALSPFALASIPLAIRVSTRLVLRGLP